MVTGVATMKIAHFSPLPPQQTGIAHYCAELLPYLSDYAEVDAYTTAEETAVSLSAQPITTFTPAMRYQYDICLYHMGNHPAYHQEIYTALRRHPGIVVLHEVNLHAFYLQREESRTAYIREMGYAYGTDGIYAARQHLSGERPLSTNNYPLFQRIVNSSLGIIVHTEFARQAILSAIPSARAVTIPLAVHLPDGFEPTVQLPELPPTAVSIGSFGVVAASKRIDVLLRALAALRSSVPAFHYYIIGKPLPDYDLSSLIDSLALNDIVHQIGYAAPDEFESYLSQIDIGVNLRTAPSGGEMSATLIRLLAHGKPTIVSNIGGFTALPDQSVLKLDQDEDEQSHLTTLLRQLIMSADKRSRYGQAARAYVRQQYAFPLAAQQHINFAKEIIHAS